MTAPEDEPAPTCGGPLRLADARGGADLLLGHLSHGQYLSKDTQLTKVLDFHDAAIFEFWSVM